jgi:dynactin complex subunit
VLVQNAALKEVLKEESDKVETLESDLVNLQQELFKEKKGKE